MIFPRAYEIISRAAYTKKVLISLVDSKSAEKLNINSIEFKVDLDATSKFSVEIFKRNACNNQSIDTFLDKFIAKDPINNQQLVTQSEQKIIISDIDRLVSTEQAKEVLENLFDALFGPNLQHCVFPIKPDAMAKLQKEFNTINYAMPLVTLTPWNNTLSFFNPNSSEDSISSTLSCDMSGSSGAPDSSCETLNI